MSDCLFCGIVAGDIPADVVHTTERTVAFRDLDPQAPTHVLVVPRDHYANAAELAAGDPVASAELVSHRRRRGHGRGPRRLPPGLQHRRRRRAERLPHPPPPAGGAQPRAGRPGDHPPHGRPRRSLPSSSLLAGCAATEPAAESRRPTPPPSRRRARLPSTRAGHATGPTKLRPLRKGEERLHAHDARGLHALAAHGRRHRRLPLLPARPRARRRRVLTGTNVVPGSPDVVHHVILFRVPPDQVAEAEQTDADTDGPGWTCFGGSGLEGDLTNLDDASWLGAWAPGGTETVTRKGYGVELPAGSRIVMQVHYNLLAGRDVRHQRHPAADHRTTRDLTPLHTYLVPAPVELPCRPAHDDGPLCDRAAAVADAKARFGDRAGATADLLHLLCGSRADAVGDDVVHPHHRPRPMTILGRRRPHAPARTPDHRRGRPGHPRGAHGPRHQAVGLRRPGLPGDRPGARSTRSTPCG